MVEQTILLKGIALMSALTGLQQWLAHEVTLYDLMFVALVSLFLITLERDYLHYIKRKDNQTEEQQKERENQPSNPKENGFFLNKQVEILLTTQFILIQLQIYFDNNGFFIYRY